MAALKRWPCGNLYRTAALRLGPHRKGVATSRPSVIHNRWRMIRYPVADDPLPDGGSHSGAWFARGADLFCSRAAP